MSSAEPPTARPPARRWGRDRLSLATVVVTGALLGAYLATVIAPDPGATPRSPAGSSEIVVVMAADTTVGGQHAALVNRWNQSHDRKIRLVEVPSTSTHWHSQLLAYLQSGRPADIVGLDVVWTAEFASAHLIQPVDRSTVPDLQDFLEPPLRSCEYGHKLYALPFESDAGLLFYNRTLLTQLGAMPRAGAHPTTSTWTWGQIAEIGQRVTSGQVDDVFLGQFAMGERIVVNALEAIDPEATWSPDRPSKLTVRQVTQLNAVFQLLHNGTDQDAWRDGYDKDTSRVRFATGRTLFMRNVTAAYRKIVLNQEADPLDMGVTQLPDPLHPILGGQNLAVASRSTDRGEAQRVIEYLTGDTAQRQMLDAGGVASTRLVPYLDQLPTGSPDAELRAATLTAIRRARPRPTLPHYSLFSAVLQEQLRARLSAEEFQPFDDRSLATLNRALTGTLDGRTW